MKNEKNISKVRLHAIFCLKFQLKNENDIKKDNTPIFLKIITFV